MRRHIQGVTLLELMVTVAIVGILAAIAYPSYRNSVLRANRTDARVALLQASQSLEKCYTQYGRYTDPACSIPSTSEHAYYTIAPGAAGINASDYELTATASGSQADDTDCAKLTIKNTSDKTATKSDGTASSMCWK